MYLRDVMVLPASRGKEDIGTLRQASDHVLYILRHYLPRKYDLGGLRRIVIYVDQGPYATDRCLRMAGDGIGEYFVPSFDLKRYFSAAQDEQEDCILRCVEDVLVDVAQKFGTDAEPLRAAVASVREAGFRLETERPCSRSHPSRKLRVAVVQQFAPGGVFVRAEIRAKRGDELHVEPLLAGAWVVTAGDTYRSSRWNGGTLELLDYAGRTTGEVPCAGYLSQ